MQPETTVSAPTSASAFQHLVAEARAGDRGALEALLSAVAPAVHRFGLRMCRNGADADDVLQDTLATITQELGGFAGRASFTSWAFALARSACARRRRGMKNQPPVADPHPDAHIDEAPSPETCASDRELAEVVVRALDGLAEDHREVLVLRDVEELSAREAAEALGVSEGALKSRLHRARAALREGLRPWLEAPRPRVARACPDVVALWSQKLDGDLSAVDCARMEEHVASCDACASACDALKRALSACRSARADAVPPSVQERVRVAARATVGTQR